MKLNIPIILYLLFLALVCMNKPKVIEGSIFSSPSNCPTVGRILNRVERKYDELCTEIESTPAPTECELVYPIIDFIKNEYTSICKPLSPGQDIDMTTQWGGDGEQGGGENGEQRGGGKLTPAENVSPFV